MVGRSAASAPVPGGIRSLRSTATPRSRCEVDGPMSLSSISRTVLTARWVTAAAGTHATPLPVARSIYAGTRDGGLHLVDGDGASLCERFTQQQLEQLPLAWTDVVATARCPVCEVLGSPFGRP